MVFGVNNYIADALEKKAYHSSDLALITLGIVLWYHRPQWLKDSVSMVDYMPAIALRRITMHLGGVSLDLLEGLGQNILEFRRSYLVASPSP